MGKLQTIKRANDSVVNSLNIPLEVIQSLGWEKGDEIEVSIQIINDEEVIIARRIENAD